MSDRRYQRDPLLYVRPGSKHFKSLQRGRLCLSTFKPPRRCNTLHLVCIFLLICVYYRMSPPLFLTSAHPLYFPWGDNNALPLNARGVPRPGSSSHLTGSHQHGLGVIGSSWWHRPVVTYCHTAYYVAGFTPTSRTGWMGHVVLGVD